MPKCVYCKKDYSIPRGLTLIMKDGAINHLCSSKCKKNMLMKRRKVRWILKDKKDAPVHQHGSTFARGSSAQVGTPEGEKEKTKKAEKTEAPKKAKKPAKEVKAEKKEEKK